MKTLADFKRAMIVGSKWETIKHFKDNLTETTPVRECSKRQANSFAFRTTLPDGRIADCWLDFPKAKDVEFLNNDTITIKNNWGTAIYKKVTPWKHKNYIGLL